MAAPTVIANPNYLSLSNDGMYFVLRSNNFTGTEPPFFPVFPNMSVYMEVWLFNADPVPDSFLAALNLPYDPFTKEAVFDIHGLKELSNTLPDFEDDYGHAAEIYAKLYVKYADQYGTPVTPDTLTVDNRQNAYYTIIKGSSLQTIGNSDSRGGFILHAYKNRQGQYFSKSITKDQPDWMFFYLTGSGTIPVNVKITMFYEDGTNLPDIDDGDIDFEGSAAHWISTSYKDRIEHLNPTQKVIAFSITLSRDVNGQMKVMAPIKFLVDDCTDKDVIVAYDNGLGGLETVRMMGDTTSDYKATRELFQKTIWGKVDQVNGQINSFNGVGQEIFKMNTGYYSEDYIFHLRQMLLGNCWLIENGKYYAINCITSEITDIRNNDETLFSIRFEFQRAIEDRSANNLHYIEAQ